MGRPTIKTSLFKGQTHLFFPSQNNFPRWMKKHILSPGTLPVRRETETVLASMRPLVLYKALVTGMAELITKMVESTQEMGVK